MSAIHFNNDDMLERKVQFGNDSYTIKAYIKCGEQDLFALECETKMTGFDGKCPRCNKQHVKLAESRDFYASVNSIIQALETKKLEKTSLQGWKTLEELNTIKEKLPPLDRPIIGRNKGIEGDSNSCYMDATIFCMFAYSNVFDSLLYMNIDQNSVNRLQKLLRENIVHVLRSREGFVERKFT